MGKCKAFLLAHKVWIFSIGGAVLVLAIALTSVTVVLQHRKAERVPTVEQTTEETGTAQEKLESDKALPFDAQESTAPFAEDTKEDAQNTDADTEEAPAQSDVADSDKNTEQADGKSPPKKPTAQTTKPRPPKPKPSTTKPRPAEMTKPNTTTPPTDAVTTTKPDGPYEPWTPKPDPNFSEQAYAEKVLDMVNAERAKVGAEPMQFAPDLQKTAELRAREITQSFSHTRPDGTPCFTAFPRGYDYKGENIAYGYPRPEMVMDGWMHSEGHKKNILNPNYTYIGIGCYEKNGTLYWTQCFGGRL